MSAGEYFRSDADQNSISRFDWTPLGKREPPLIWELFHLTSHVNPTFELFVKVLNDAVV